MLIHDELLMLGIEPTCKDGFRHEKAKRKKPCKDDHRKKDHLGVSEAEARPLSKVLFASDY